MCRDEVKETKPNPDIFLKTADKLSISPEQCIVIEDSSAGIEAAFNAGMIPIHVVDLKEADEEILSKAYKSFNNLNSDVFDLQYLKNYANRWEGKVFINFTHSGDINPLDVASFVNGYITAWNKTNYHGFPFGCKVIQTNHREYIVQHYKGE